MHSIEYVMKIVNELNKTPDEVMRQVMEYKGSIVFGNKAAYKYLRQFSAKEIRMILTYKRKEKENE